MAVYTVTTTSDVVDGSDGVTSLREALSAAAASGGADTIRFSAGLANAQGQVTVQLGSALTIADAGGVTIDGDVNGNGSGDVTIDAQGLSRHFTISVGAVATLVDVTLTNGAETGVQGADGQRATQPGGFSSQVFPPTDAQAGGEAVASILNNGTLTLTDVVLTANVAAGGQGGVGGRGDAEGAGGQTYNPGSSGTGGVAAVVVNSGTITLGNVDFGANLLTGGRGGTGAFGVLTPGQGATGGGAAVLVNRGTLVGNDVDLSDNTVTGGLGGTGGEVLLEQRHAGNGGTGGLGAGILTFSSATISDLASDGNQVSGGTGGLGGVAYYEYGPGAGGAGGDGGLVVNTATASITVGLLGGDTIRGGNGGNAQTDYWGWRHKDGGAGGDGGAVINSGTLTLDDLVFGQESVGGGGGGVGGGFNYTTTYGTAGQGGLVVNAGTVTGDASNFGQSTISGSATGAVLNQGAGTSTGLSMLAPATISLSSATVTVTEGDSGGTTLVTLTVTYTGTGTASVDVAFAAGTGVTGADFTGGALPASVQTVSFAAGETTKTVTFEIAADQRDEANESFTATLANASGSFPGAILGSVNQTTVTITDDDFSPVFSNAAAVTFAENTFGAGTGAAHSSLTVAATDADGDAVTLAMTGGADSGLFSFDAATGKLAFVAPANFEQPADAGGNNVYEVEMTATDGQGNATVQMVRVTVANVNEAPVFTSATAVTIDENATAVQTVATTDQDGDTRAYSIGGGADAALFQIDAQTGALSFRDAPDFGQPRDVGADNAYEVVVTADDGHGGVTTQTIAVTVQNIADAPSFVTPAALAIAENTTGPLNVTAQDDDSDTVTLSVAGGADAALFTFDAATGALSFVTAPNFEVPADADGDGFYEIDIAASDGVDGSTVRHLRIEVTDAATGDSDIVVTTASDVVDAADGVLSLREALALAEGGGGADRIVFDQSILDAAGKLTISLSGAMTISAGHLLLDGDVNDDGVADVTLDAHGASRHLNIGAAATVTVDGFVFNGGREDGANAYYFGTNYNGTYYNATDPYAQALTAGADGGDATSSIANAGALTLTHVVFEANSATGGRGGEGGYNRYFRGGEGGQGGDAATISNVGTLTLDDVSFVGDNLAGGSGGRGGGTNSAPSNYSYYPTGGGAAGSGGHAGVIVNSGVLNVSDTDFGGTVASGGAVGFPGAYYSSYTGVVYGPAGAVGTGALLVNLGTAAGEIGEYLAQLTGAGAAEYVTVDAGTGSVTVRHRTVDFDAATMSAAEGDSGTTLVTVTLTRPDLFDAAGSVVVSLSGATLSADDFAAGVLPSAQTVTFAAGEQTKTITFEIAGDTELEGDETFTLVLGSPTGMEVGATGTIVVTVSNDDEAPVIAGDGAPVVDENTTEVGTYAITDADGDAMTLTLDGADAALFTLDAATGALTFVVPPNFEQPADAGADNVHQVTIVADDGHGGITRRDLLVTVADVNETPLDGTILADLSVTEDRVSLFTIAPSAFMDVDAGDHLTLSATLADGSPLPDWLAFDPASGVFGSAPSEGGISVRVRVTATDIAGLSTFQDFTLSVTNVNEAPVIVSNGGLPAVQIDLAENATALGQVQASDPDAGDTLAYSIQGGADAALFAIDPATGALRFVVGPDFEARTDADSDNRYEVVVRASDGTLVDDQAITVQVRDVLAELIHGTAADDLLLGMAYSDTLHGGQGDDQLDGGKGADLMVGGAGNDTYFRDNDGDVFFELAGGGTDTVLASVSTALSAHVERLVLTGTDAIRGTGNGLANEIIGNDAANLLVGGRGGDHMVGGKGNDTYYLDDVGDIVEEIDGEGTDTVISTVDHTLGAAFENLSLTGTTAIQAGGNAQANRLVGNVADNLLAGAGGADNIYGGDGDDTITGGEGRDVMAGQDGADLFVFSTVAESVAGAGRDVVRDFHVGVDRIDLSAFGAQFVSGAFSQGGGAEVRAIVFGTSTIVCLDAEGDGVADLQIILAGVSTPLTAASFVL